MVEISSRDFQKKFSFSPQCGYVYVRDYAKSINSCNDFICNSRGRWVFHFPNTKSFDLVKWNNDIAKMFDIDIEMYQVGKLRVCS